MPLETCQQIFGNHSRKCVLVRLESIKIRGSNLKSRPGWKAITMASRLLSNEEGIRLGATKRALDQE